MSKGEVGDSAPHSSAHTTTKPIAITTNLVANRDCRVQSLF